MRVGLASPPLRRRTKMRSHLAEDRHRDELLLLERDRDPGLVYVPGELHLERAGEVPRRQARRADVVEEGERDAPVAADLRASAEGLVVPDPHEQQVAGADEVPRIRERRRGEVLRPHVRPGAATRQREPQHRQQDRRRNLHGDL